MDIKENILIFSAYLGMAGVEENKTRHQQARQSLVASNVPFIELLGKYNGVAEQSFLVIGFEHEAFVKKLSVANSQESYLRSHNDRFSELVHLGVNGGEDFIQAMGYLVEVPEAEAEASQYYSYNPSTKQYFITKNART